MCITRLISEVVCVELKGTNAADYCKQHNESGRQAPSLPGVKASLDKREVIPTV